MVLIKRFNLNHVLLDGIKGDTLGTTTGVVNGFVILFLHFRSDSADTIKWTSAWPFR